MKKIIITLSVLLTLSLAGVLYGTHGKYDEREAATLEQVYRSQYPVPMPDVTFAVNSITF